MKEILHIQRHDLRAVTRSFFAILILIAVAILSALYAWVNIYANMDPYGSTGNVRIAVASRDSGIVDADGVTVNKAREVLDELRESTAIGWQFPDSADDAIEGVRSGEYYAAIIFEKLYLSFAHPDLPGFLKNGRSDSDRFSFISSVTPSMSDMLSARYAVICSG